jgi:succinate dehydrogenase/fumarate reductase flavoprotein subunit
VLMSEGATPVVGEGKGGVGSLPVVKLAVADIVVGGNRADVDGLAKKKSNGLIACGDSACSCLPDLGGRMFTRI